MKNLVPWLKAHWIIPVLTLVALAVLPTAWYFADEMQTGFVTDFQNSVKKEADSVSDTAVKNKYYIPSVSGDGSVLEVSQPFNEAMIKRYGEIWESVSKEVATVSDKGMKFNQGDHKLIIEGLFPPPADSVTAQNKALDFVERLMQFHKMLLADIRAGEAAKAETIIQQLTDFRTAEENKIRAELGREPNPEEQAKITEKLLAMRISAVRKHASEIGVFADASAFPHVPASIPDVAPSPSQAWDMQEKAWIDQDICHAISIANGKTGGVPDSVVKRLVKVDIKAAGWDATTPNPQVAAYDPGEDKVTLNFGVSLTGRTSGPGSKNKWYDVRAVTIDVIISSARIPQFLNALAATNFMTITDLDIAKVDPLSDLREGFDYGDDHVVKATIQLETVWLREWRKAAMPPAVQKALGMVEGVAGDTAASAPSPPRNPRPNPGAAGRPPGGPGAAPKGRGGGNRDD